MYYVNMLDAGESSGIDQYGAGSSDIRTTLLWAAIILLSAILWYAFLFLCDYLDRKAKQRALEEKRKSKIKLTSSIKASILQKKLEKAERKNEKIMQRENATMIAAAYERDKQKLLEEKKRMQEEITEKLRKRYEYSSQNENSEGGN